MSRPLESKVMSLDCDKEGRVVGMESERCELAL